MKALLIASTAFATLILTSVTADARGVRGGGGGFRGGGGSRGGGFRGGVWRRGGARRDRSPGDLRGARAAQAGALPGRSMDDRGRATAATDTEAMAGVAIVPTVTV